MKLREKEKDNQMKSLKPMLNRSRKKQKQRKRRNKKEEMVVEHRTTKKRQGMKARELARRKRGGADELQRDDFSYSFITFRILQDNNVYS